MLWRQGQLVFATLEDLARSWTLTLEDITGALDDGGAGLPLTEVKQPLLMALLPHNGVTLPSYQKPT